MMSRNSADTNTKLTWTRDGPMNKRFRSVYVIPEDYEPHGPHGYKHARYFVVTGSTAELWGIKGAFIEII